MEPMPKSFHELINNSLLPVLADFGAEWLSALQSHGTGNSENRLCI